MLRKARILTLSLVVVLVAAALADAETLGEIIALVEKKSRSIKDMSCTLKMDMDIMGQKMSMEGPMKMKLPNMLSMEADVEAMTPAGKMKMRMKVVSDGQTTWQEVKVGENIMVRKNDAKTDGIDMGGVSGMGPMPSPSEALTQLRETMDVEQLPDEMLNDGQEAWVIKGKLKPKAYRMMKGRGALDMPSLKSQMAGMKLYIGQQDQYINRMEFLSSSGQTTGTMEFLDLKFNQGFGPGEFTYEVPEGAQVNKGLQMLGGTTTDAPTGTEAEPAKETVREMPKTVLKVGASAPVFTVETLEGETLDLAKLRGKPAVVFFWATWHKGSVRVLAELDELKKAQKAAGLEVVAVSLDEPDALQDVKKAVTDRDISVKTAIGNDTIFDAYQVREIPTYVLIDADGKVIASEAKPRNASLLKKALLEHLGKLAKK